MSVAGAKGGRSKSRGKKGFERGGKTWKSRTRIGVDRDKQVIVHKEQGGFYDAIKAAAAAAKGFIWKEKGDIRVKGRSARIIDGKIAIGSKKYEPVSVTYTLREVKKKGRS